MTTKAKSTQKPVVKSAPAAVKRTAPVKTVSKPAVKVAVKTAPAKKVEAPKVVAKKPVEQKVVTAVVKSAPVVKKVTPAVVKTPAPVTAKPQAASPVKQSFVKPVVAPKVITQPAKEDRTTPISYSALMAKMASNLASAGRR